MRGAAGAEIAEKTPSSPRMRSAPLPGGEKRELVAIAFAPYATALPVRGKTMRIRCRLFSRLPTVLLKRKSAAANLPP